MNIYWCVNKNAYRLQSDDASPSSAPTDGKGDTTHVNNDLDHLDYYSWKDKNETPLSRGQALLFYKAKQEKFDEMESALAKLAFATTSMSMQNMESVITNGIKMLENCSASLMLVPFISKSRGVRQWMHLGVRVRHYFQKERPE